MGKEGPVFACVEVCDCCFPSISHCDYGKLTALNQTLSLLLRYRKNVLFQASFKERGPLCYSPTPTPASEVLCRKASGAS